MLISYITFSQISIIHSKWLYTNIQNTKKHLIKEELENLFVLNFTYTCVSHFNWTTSIIYEIITPATLHRKDKFSTNSPQAEYWTGVLFSWKERNFSSVMSCGFRSSPSSNFCTSDFDVSISLTAVWQVDEMRINRMKKTIKYPNSPYWSSPKSNKVMKITVMTLTNNEHVKVKTENPWVSLMRERT